MGTILFWLTWLAVAVFYAVTTRRQRQTWFWLVWLLAIGITLIASTMNLLNQGYPTVL